MPTSPNRTPGIRVLRGAAEPLAAELVTWLREPGPDPFAPLTVCVESPGMQRRLARWLGAALGAGGEGDGICAGVDFPSLSRVTRRVTAAVVGVSGRADPWSASRLPWAVLATLTEHRHRPEFEVVARHLGEPGDPSRPGRAFAVARRIAGLFRRYVQHRPDLVRSWSAGGLGGVPAEHEWQARLWHELVQRLEVPDPVDRHDLALAALRSDEQVAGVPPSLAIFAPTQVSALETEFLAAYGETRPVLALVVGPVDPFAAGVLLPRLAHDDRLLAAALPPAIALPDLDRPSTLLGAVQCAVADTAVGLAPIDDSIQVHLSHGPERQVEVLRELLTDALASDPTLEPRDIVVLCPDLPTYAPLLTAALCLPPEAEPVHPGHGLRVRVVPDSSPASNPLLALLIRLCDFVGSRVTAPDLLELAAEPPVAARFGFTPDSLIEVDALLWQAGVRWGIDQHDRARFGLSGLAQGTLRAGLDRLLVGVALDSSDLTTIGGVLPVDNIESSSVSTVGALAELIARIERFSAAAREVRPAAEWANLLWTTVTEFAAVSGTEMWQMSAVVGVLADLAAAAGSAGGDLALADMRAALADRLRDASGRNAFGTGALTVCSLGAQRHVPHRVVFLLGIDEQTFPRGEREDGDDLLGIQPGAGDPDPRRTDRQLFLDALLAARERFVVIGRHRSPQTNEQVPLALPVLDLLDAVAAATGEEATAVVREHSLYPYSRSACEPTYDIAAARARATATPRPSPVFDPEAELPPIAPLPLGLPELRRFLRNPLSVFLSVRGGIPTWTADPWQEELPLDMSALDLWQVGDRTLRAAMAGTPPAVALTAERARGVLPPYELATGPEAEVAAKVRRILSTAERLPDAPVEHLDLRVDLGDRIMSGTVAVQGDAICSVSYSRLNNTNSLDSFLPLLLLQAARPGTRWRSLLATSSDLVSWRLADVDPLAQLRILAALYDIGLTRPLPLPFRTGYDHASAFHGTDPEPLTTARETWRRRESDRPVYEKFWPTFDDLLAAPIPAELPADVRPAPTLFATLSRAVWSPVFTERQ